jgi:hypothetical protein
VISFRHGRLLLAAHVISIFRVDIEWTKRHLLPLFDWQDSEVEATTAWKGFLWSPRLYRPLIEAFKSQFLAASKHYEQLGKHGRQYATLFTFAALDQGNSFSRAELAKATRSLPVTGLENVAETLVRALKSAEDQRGEYWRNRVLPYLRHIWPKSCDIISPAISASLSRLCVAAQDDFPAAFKELKHWLQPLRSPDSIVHSLHETGLPERFPEESLAFLDVLISDDTQWPPRDLKDCLDGIRLNRLAMETDDRFLRLMEYLRVRMCL